MRIVRFIIQGKAKYGVLEGDVIRGFRGNPFVHFRGNGGSSMFDGIAYELDNVRLLAPCLPSKIVGIGRNYRDHVAEIKSSIPSVPRIFIKPSTAVIGPDGKIILPPLPRNVEYEGELGAVIGKKTKDVSRDKVKDYVLGYTCANDVSERNAQKEDGQATRAKSFDTFAPIGPCIETEVDPDDLKLETYLNGELRQSTRTSALIFGVAELISFISRIMMLLPGDIVITGTPSGVGHMSPGDIVEVRIERIGTLRNFVVGHD